MPHNLSPEDLALWLSITEKVQPIEREELPEDSAPPRKKRIMLQQDSAYCVPKPTKQSSSHTLTRQQYRHYTIEARLDLHGYTQEEAHNALIKFIQINYGRQKRTLLIITGKGSVGKGILRQELPLWLNMEPLSRMIVAQAPARPEDGGQGALYVLLRRIP